MLEVKPACDRINACSAAEHNSVKAIELNQGQIEGGVIIQFLDRDARAFHYLCAQRAKLRGDLRAAGPRTSDKHTPASQRHPLEPLDPFAQRDNIANDDQSGTWAMLTRDPLR